MKHSIAKSIFALILVVSLLTIGITAAMSVYEAEIFVRETMISKASNAAQVISRFYYGVLPETIIDDKAVSAEMSDTFQSLIKSFQLEYLYIMIPHVDSGQITYVCVAGNEETREIAESLPPGTVKKRDISNELASVIRGETSLITRETDNQYGHVFSVYVPLLDPDESVTAVIGADINASKLTNRFARVILWRVLISLATVILSSFVFYFVLKRKVIKPAETISDAMKAFGENDRYDAQPIVIRGDNEFSHIGTSFNDMAAIRVTISPASKHIRNCRTNRNTSSGLPLKFSGDFCRSRIIRILSRKSAHSWFPQKMWAVIFTIILKTAIIWFLLSRTCPGRVSAEPYSWRVLSA